MATVKWEGNAASTAQAASYVVTDGSPGAGEVWTFNITDESGNANAVSYTVVTSDTATLIATGLTNAVNNHTSAAVRRITATSSGATLTLTAATAGVPYTIGSFANTAASASGWGVATSVTASTGPNDYNTAENWSDDAVPDGSDGVLIPGSTTASILYGLNQSSVTVDKFVVEEGYAGVIGGTNKAYFRIGVDADAEFKFSGSGQAWIDIAASDVDPIINRTSEGSSGSYGLSLKGTAISDIYLNRGNLGFGIEADDTTSEVDTVHIGYVANETSDSTITIGSGVSDTSGGTIDINMYGGNAYVHCSVGTLNQYSTAATYRQQVGTYTTATINGTLYPNATSTYATTTLGPSSNLINTETTAAKTFTAVTASDGCRISDPIGTITWTNGIDFANSFMKDSDIDFGFNKIVTPTNS